MTTSNRSSPTRRASGSRIGQRRAAARDRNGASYTRRRAEIVAAAAQVFRDKGYQASTLTDVATAVGVGRATLYFYVGSKQEIFDEIVADVVKANLAQAEEIAASTDPGSVKLRLLVTRLTRSLAENHPFLHVYLQEHLGHPAEKPDGWAPDLRLVNRRYEAAVRSIIQQGVDDGTLRAVVHTQVIALGLLGMVCWTHRWFDPARSPVDAAAIGEAYAEILLEGLVARAEASPVDGASPRPVPHPDVVAILERFAAADIPSYDSLSVAQARAQLEAVVKLQNAPEPVDHVEDVMLDGASGLLPARIYRPAAHGPLPVVVYLHGGGWVIGSVQAADGPCRALANAAPCVVVSVDYRLAPETKFPGPLEDCVSAVRWVAARATSLGGSERLVLVGDSAGGNLATAAAAVLRDQGGPPIAAQVLIYPTLAPASTTDFASYQAFANGPLMTRRELDWFWQHYLRGPEDATDPLAAPLHATEVRGLPDTTVIVAELDPLHDEGVAYARKLEAAGVTVRLLDILGAAHGFWWMDRVMSQAAELTATVAGIVRGLPQAVPERREVRS